MGRRRSERGRTAGQAGLFSLVPALLLLWGAAMAVRWSGGVSRMRWVEQAVLKPHADALQEPPLLARVRSGVSTGLLGQVLDRVDPFHSREASALGALLVLLRHENAWQNLMRQPRMAPLIKCEVLRPLIKDNDVIHALSFSHYSKLLTLPEMTAAVSPRRCAMPCGTCRWRKPSAPPSPARRPCPSPPAPSSWNENFSAPPQSFGGGEPKLLLGDV